MCSFQFQEIKSPPAILYRIIKSLKEQKWQSLAAPRTPNWLAREAAASATSGRCVQGTATRLLGSGAVNWHCVLGTWKLPQLHLSIHDWTMQHYCGKTQFLHDFACLSKKVFPYFHLPNLTLMHLTDGLNPEIHLPGCLEIVFSFPTPVVYYRERGTDTELIVSAWFSSYLVTRPLRGLTCPLLSLFYLLLLSDWFFISTHKPENSPMTSASQLTCTLIYFPSSLH